MEEMRQLIFGWTDYTLFGGLLGVSLLIGIYFGFFSKQDSASEYLFGGKTMSYIPVATSILASFLSGITFLGIPTEVYFHGAMYALSALPAIGSGLMAAYVFLPIFFDLQLASCYEYLELRFSRTIRQLASFLYTVSLMLYIPVVMYVPALAFSQVTGYSVHTITPVFSFVCITYTTLGGVKAVVWTDTIQFFFTIGGLFTVLAIGLKSIGGPGEVWRISKEGGRLDIFDMNPSPFVRTTFWSIVIGNFFSNLSRFGVGQKFVQRFLSIEKKSDIRKAVLILIIGWIVLQFSCVVAGLTLYAKYHGCDPLSAKLVSRNDQTLPYYVMDVAGHIHGLPGVFLAGLVSSALSTMSASLNTLSGTIYEDFVDPWIADSPGKEAKSARIMKLISLIIGAVTVALIFVIEHMGTVFEMSNSLSTIVDGPLLGLFVAGMYAPWIGRRGVLAGACLALAFMAWLSGGLAWHLLNKRIQYPILPTSTDQCPYPLNETLAGASVGATTAEPRLPGDEPLTIFRISFFYLILVGMSVTLAVASVVSLALGEGERIELDPRHFAPAIRRFLPEKKKYVEVPLKDVIKEPIK